MNMDDLNEEVMRALYEDNVNIPTITWGMHVNKICSNGMTLLGAAAQSGNLTALKTLLEYQIYGANEKNKNKLFQEMHTDNVGTQKRHKNIGYFIVCKDMEENEFGDGPTPEGMDALEWDMEVNDDQVPQGEEMDDSTINMYKWYADILNKTSILLESPEQDFGRLDRHGQSVLHYAVKSGNTDMVEYLMSTLGRELSVNQNDAYCFSPLHMAAANGDTEMARLLIRKGAIVNTAGGKQRLTPLHVAIREGHTLLARMLIDSNADVNAVDVEDGSALTTAVRHNNEEIVYVLVKCGARVNHEESGGVTPLRLAVWGNNANIVKTLIESGARIVHSHYLLHSAVMNDNLKIVQVLVDAGSPLNVRDEQGYTPLMCACSRNNISIVTYLLSRNADVNIASHIDSKTSLHVCVQDIRAPYSIRELFQVLIDHGADMNATGYQGNVLFYSIILGNKQAAYSLIQHGVDVNRGEERAYVDILSLAKRYGDPHLVKLIVLSGFRLTRVSLDTETPQEEIRNFLSYVKTNPLNLRELCRIAIRRRLGSKKLLSRVQALPLPNMLLKYLSLEVL